MMMMMMLARTRSRTVTAAETRDKIEGSVVREGAEAATCWLECSWGSAVEKLRALL